MQTDPSDPKAKVTKTRSWWGLKLVSPAYVLKPSLELQLTRASDYTADARQVSE